MLAELVSEMQCAQVLELRGLKVKKPMVLEIDNKGAF
jgi:hypothetical protein